ncbi:MAG TPA: response regulator [Flavitalea sp.]|nr:response regulator [Flavitalea sp.]
MKKILIVDDDEDDKDFLCEAIQKIESSAYCIWVSDGVHALTLINDRSFNPPDFIFLDLNMPKIGGIQCLEKIRKLEHYESIPVIIYTTSKISIEQFEIHSLGPISILTKPTRIAELSKAVDDIFRSQQKVIN